MADVEAPNLGPEEHPLGPWVEQWFWCESAEDDEYLEGPFESRPAALADAVECCGYGVRVYVGKLSMVPVILDLEHEAQP